MSPDFVRFCHRFNGTSASIIGLLANIILIYLVFKSKLGAYKRLLLQMTFVDCTFLVFSGLVDPIFMFLDGTEIVVQNGILRRIPQPYSLFFLSGWIFGIYFSVFSICIQFLYRYLILCRRQTVANTTLLSMLLIPFVMASSVAVLFQLAFVFEPEEDEFITHLVKDYVLESGQHSIYPSGICRKGNVFLLALVIVALIMFSINYCIIVFCVTRISATLKELAPSLKPSTRALHTQLSKILFVQAVSPLLVSIVPLLFIFYCIVFKGTAFFSMMVMTTGFSWIPCVNAGVTLFFVRQFRSRVLRWLTCHPTLAPIGSSVGHTTQEAGGEKADATEKDDLEFSDHAV